MLPVPITVYQTPAEVTSTLLQLAAPSLNAPTVPATEALGPDEPFLKHCATCANTGFVPCAACDAQGVVRNERSGNVFYCRECVGHKKLRCPACGGKCYMC